MFTEVPRMARWLAGWPGVDIVISSSWPKTHSQWAMVELLRPEVGTRVICRTPLLTLERQLGRRGWAQAPHGPVRERQQEVLAWLNASWQPQRPWVVLDGMPNLFEPGCAQLVVCDGRTGLTAENLLRLDEHAGRAELVAYQPSWPKTTRMLSQICPRPSPAEAGRRNRRP